MGSSCDVMELRIEGGEEVGGKKGVRRGENLLLHGISAVGRLVQQKWCSTTIIEEVNAGSGVPASIGRSKTTIEVGQEVNRRAVELSWCEDTRDRDTNVGLGV